MRPLRLLLTSLCLVLATTFLLYMRLSVAAETNSDSGQHARVGKGFDNYFSFPRPSSFFTPSATISLTDDNSTYFAARPAAFGPLLPRHGLSGQIWVGKGFGNDYLKKSGMIQDFEGELGCSDIQGWTERGQLRKSTLKAANEADTEVIEETNQHSERKGYTSDGEYESEDLPAKDGTDDDLHYPLQGTKVPRRHFDYSTKSKEPQTHLSDMQSIQESAEISGKIVLLSRGGCGFSEKVKWAQRRGATAVIVGDNQLGGPLVRMFARGDTSNITVPSIFTSHTTAHLLSSLVPHGSSSDASHSGISGSAIEDNRAASDGTSDVAQGNGMLKVADTKPSSTVTSRGTINPTMYPFSNEAGTRHDDSNQPENQKGWLKSSLHALGMRDDEKENSAETDESHRPPGSGNLRWLRVEDFEEDEAWQATRRSAVPHNSAKDDFVIGVHDWRDPDVANKPSLTDEHSRTLKSSASVTISTSSVLPIPSNGGFITPGSGEYGFQIEDSDGHKEKSSVNMQKGSKGKSHHKGWKKHFPWGRESETASTERLDSPANDRPSSPPAGLHNDERKPLDEDNNGKKKNRDHHDGLWVTLTPSDMNTSPFLNTLFILVVSPLITLAIVYSMLLLRSRIRRRRWRAPKSLVERLPVRVYHTFSQTNTPPPENSQSSGAEDAATPLLSRNRTLDIRSRPRSNTIGVASSTSSSPHYGTLEAPSSSHEKADAALGERRRKYEGKQMECVVCLEEYIDGVSRVMSLPCGHEFHVDCITPWLTTRRRTCPICKGDVVRSMNQSSSVGASSAPDADLAEDDIQVQAAETVNNSPAAAMPIPSSDISAADVERGDAVLNTPSDQTYLSTSWIGSVGRRLNIISARSSSTTRTPRETPPDRNR